MSMFDFTLGDRVFVRKGPGAGEVGRIAICDSPVSEDQGEWKCMGKQGFLLIWVVLDDKAAHSADPSGGSWRLAMNLRKEGEQG